MAAKSDDREEKKNCGYRSETRADLSSGYCIFNGQDADYENNDERLNNFQHIELPFLRTDSVTRIMESLGVPTLGIGDQIPPYSADSTQNRIELHDWVIEGQSFNPGEEVFTVILTFPTVRNPVVASEFAFLGRPETQKEIAARRMKILLIVTCSLYEVHSFLREVPQILDVTDWALGDIPIIADESGDLQRYLVRLTHEVVEDLKTKF